MATAKIPGMSKVEQGVKNQFKGINMLSSPEPLKQLCPLGGLKPMRGGPNDGGDLMSLTPIVFLESHCFNCVTIVLQVYYNFVSSVLGVFFLPVFMGILMVIFMCFLIRVWMRILDENFDGDFDGNFDGNFDGDFDGNFDEKFNGMAL